ncbi:MAG: ATP-binding cassette domain-containing protein [Proteobacteria bacterium]|nr:ATP-binding cassette domain-containing protein [Pseudomonadota bacterium]
MQEISGRTPNNPPPDNQPSQPRADAFPDEVRQSTQPSAPAPSNYAPAAPIEGSLPRIPAATTPEPVAQQTAPKADTAGASSASTTQASKLSAVERAMEPLSDIGLSLSSGYFVLNRTLGPLKAHIALINSAIAGSEYLIYGFLFAGLIDQIVKADTNSATFLSYAVGFGVTRLISSTLNSLSARWTAEGELKTQDLAQHGLRQSLFRQSYEEFHIRNLANSVSQVSENLWRFEKLAEIPKVVVGTLTTIGVSTYAISQAPWSVLYCALASCVIPVIQSIHMARRSTSNEQQIAEPRRKVWWRDALLTQPMVSKETRVQGCKEVLEEKREESREPCRQIILGQAQLKFRYSMLSGPISTGCVLTAMYLLGRGASAGTITVGLAGLVATQAYPIFSRALQEMVGVIGNLMEAGPHLKLYLGLVGAKEGASRSKDLKEAWKPVQITEPPNTAPLSGTTVTKPPVPKLELDNVRYAYPSTDDPQKRGAPLFPSLNLSIKPGSMVMLCGGNGAGKSTIFEALVGLRQPTHGQILVDGASSATMDKTNWSKQLGVVFQDFKLFASLSFRNILYLHGKNVDSAYEKRVLEVTGVQALLDEETGDPDESGNRKKKFPAGLDSIFGENFKNGLALSGGEAQKFAIARALLRRPSILVLDEFTSNLDPEDARRLYIFLANRESPENLGYKPTVIFTTHDYTKGEYADEIIMFEKGKGIIEQGSFTELNGKTGGAFKRKHDAC